MIKKETRDKIISQALEEIAFARDAKRDIIKNWHKNEDLYYSKKKNVEIGRANVNLNETLGFVQSFLTKIHTPYNFKYEKGEEADLKAAKRVNAIKEKDRKAGRWDYKLMLARIQFILYGRYIFEYHASSSDGYKSHLSNVDVYQFLIDPSAGGEDIEKALYLGRGNIIKSKKDIEKGIKSGKYLKKEATELISGSSNFNDETKEDVDSNNRWVHLINKAKIIEKKDQWKFWEWYTTYEGERYYVLVTESGGKGIKCEKLTDVFESGMYPFFSAATYPDLTEFWSPSPVDGVRETIMAKSVSINQMLDNGEAINRPMKAFNVDAIKNPNLLKYRTDGLIPVKGNVKIDEAVQFFPVTPIGTSIQVYDKLAEITDINSGVTSGIKGQASEKQVGIYEGNQANATSRFSLVSDSEADAQQRFSELYLAGLDEHLKTRTAIEMIGIDGIEFEEITRKDIKRKKKFDVVIITTGTEETMKTTEKRNKLTFLSAKSNDMSGVYNKKIMAEMEASIAGFTTEEIKYMLDNKNEGNAELMSECANDIQRMLGGEYIEVNDMANTAYMQKIKDYLRDQKEYMMKHPDIAELMFDYLERLQPVVMENMYAEMNQQLAGEGLPTAMGQANGIDFQQAPVNPETGGSDTGVSNAVQQSTLQNYGR